MKKNQEEADTIHDDLIFRISKPNVSVYRKLQVLVLKLLLLLWDENEKEDLDSLEEKLELIDNIRHELSFLRAKYYKKVINAKLGIKY